MAQLNRSRSRFRLPPAGLMLQLFAIILLPLTLLLVAITFGSIEIHQKAMRSMVGERDERMVRTVAGAFSAQLDQRLKDSISLKLLLSESPDSSLASSLEGLDYLLPDFDAGVAIFDLQGRLISASGNQQAWEAWTKDPARWQVVFHDLAAQVGMLKVYPDPAKSTPLGLVSQDVKGSYLVIGAFSITSLAQNVLADTLPPGGGLSVMLVGADHQVLYKLGDLTDQTVDHPGVNEALMGHSGTLYVTVGGDEHVTAYSPVASSGWALITEESWQAVSTPTLRLTQTAPLVLVPAVLIMLVALWLGARQIVKPLRDLESKAATLAWGDFKTIQEPVGGIAEIQHLQQELVRMANKVNAAQHSLHSYIGAITEAQEEERRRLARELHDDTLQALIALQQRVQLAQLELQTSAGPGIPLSPELDEIASLTGQTIENLRRLTRDLRPVYLEDLGLVPALEMLARETSQAAGLTIEFHHHGVERRLETSAELALYRMAQEALSNISRHAQAKRASLVISFLDNSVTLQVMDDGVGFDLLKNPAEYAASGHFGLLGLHERAELIGAVLEIRSAPGQGTSLTIKLTA